MFEAAVSQDEACVLHHAGPAILALASEACLARFFGFEPQGRQPAVSQQGALVPLRWQPVSTA